MKKSIIKNISLGIACLLGVGGAVVAASILSNNKPFEEARADDNVQFIYRYWNEGTKEVKSMQGNIDTYTPVTSTTTYWTGDNGGYYVVNSNVSISSRVTVTGTVNLILCDGAKLTAEKGISVLYGTTVGENTLNIYGQTNDSGKLVSTVSSNSLGAAIGGNDNTNCGTINIYGGDIESTGSNAAAAIGGGANSSTGGKITIYGGKVTANAYYKEGDVCWASGIGGGSNGAGGIITIYGGTVNAYGTTGGAGIGGGVGSAAAGGTITINGGIVNATSRGVCAAIGGGHGASAGEITINGGIITATNTGNDSFSGDGAGIGGGVYATDGSVRISGGIVTATGGNNGANGIGAGKGGKNVTLTVDGLDVLGNNEHEPTISDIKTDYSTNRWRYMIVKDTRHIHDDITFSPWTSSDSLPDAAGSYYLTTDVTLTNKSWNVPGDVNLCLNDHIITIASSDWQHCINLSYSTNPKTLNLYDEPHTMRYWINDSDSDYRFHGKIVSQSEYNSYTGYKGTFVGGAITSNIIEVSQRTLYVQSSNIFNMYGGNIVGSYGHAIEATGTSNITINGGKITGSSIAIYSDTSGNVTINGGEISGNQNGIRSTNPTGPINLNGGKISDTNSIPYSSEAVSGCVINYNGTELINNKCDFRVNSNTGYLKLEKPLPENSTYKIMCAQDGVFTKNWSTYMGEADPAEYFECYYENKTVERDGDEAAYRTTYTITYDGNGATSGTVPDPEVYISGRTATIAGNTGNLEKEDLVFAGWNTKADGTGDSYKAGSSMTVTATTTLYAQWSDHIHNFSYSNEGNTITAICDNADGNCPLPNRQATLTITGPSGSSVYDGTEKPATYVDTSSGVAFSNIKITYFKQGDTSFSGVPTDAGTYIALMSFNESYLRASIQYDILKAGASLTAPTAKTGLIYTGSAQELINAGSTSDGTIQYRLEDGEYSTDITTGINAGTYTVYYKVFGDSNHNDSGEQSLVVSISKATVDPVGTLNSTYGKTLGDVILPNGWAWDDPISTSVGNAGNQSFDATFAEQLNYNEAHQTVTINVATADPDPVGTLDATFGQKLSDVALPAGWAWDDATQSVGNVGSHDFAAHYTAVDANHHDKDASITVSVSQATPTGYDIPTDLNATYGDTLSSVELPDTWAWKNPNDKVGNAGNREHIAIYTPTDPNYKAVEESLTVSVAKANPTYTLPTDIEMYTNETLSSVTLPSGFSWMDESIKASSVGENTFKVRYTPVDTANYNVIENIDVKVNVKWEVVDPSSSSTSIVINGADEAYTTDISVKVEVKTDISVEQKHNEYASLATNSFVKPNEDIVEIYNVKLIRTTNGVEEEIQPSDIKPGTKIIISMAIPENLVGKEFRLLHIHNSDDITEVTNYSVSEDGKTLMVEVDRLSEFAFIGATDKDNGFIYNSTPIWALILLIIFSIILLVGIYCLYRLIKDRNDNSNNGDKSVKTMSITFISPILLAYLGLNGIIIAFIVVAALSIIVWVTNLCLFIANKKRKHAKLDEAKEVKKEEAKPVEEVKPVETVKEPEPVNEEEEEEVFTITDEKGNIFNIRYIKSFTAKLIQSPIETKKFYEELKNYVLSYKKTTSRISWHYDSINSGRNQVLKFAIRGKTLCVYYPLNASDYEDSKYKVESVESKKFEEVPCLYRIKNDRRLGYAKDLIDTVMANLGLVRGEEQHEVYSNLPYEKNRPLIARGLIKEQKVQVNKPAEEVVSKKVNDEGDEIITTKDSSGNLFEIRYIKSFTAKLSQASEEVKDYYNELKNYALSYKRANSRVSWHFDSINVGRNQVIKFSIRGKTLCVYYALNANDYNDTKYKVEVVESKKFEEVPCLYRIKNDRRRDYAKDLIDTVMANVPTELGKESNEDFRIPYESTKALLAKGLIKENKVQVNKPVEDKPVEQVIESHEDEEGNEVVLSQDNAGNVYETRYVKSFRARLIEASDEAKEYYKELRDYILSYQDVDESISWLYDSINYNREQLFKLNIRGKTLCIYYALDTSKVGEKYKVENSDTKKYSKVPCLYRISNPRRVKLAKELIDRVMRKHKLILGEEYHDAYHLKNKSRDELIKKGLIKEVKILVK